MSESNIKSSIIYKIRQQRQKRSEKCIEQEQESKDQINFYLSYEEFYNTHGDKDIDQSKIKIKERLLPISKDTSGQKEMKKLHHAKKISLNFDLLNPKRRQKVESQDNNKINFEEMFIHSKQMYFLKIERLKRKKSDKCKNISIFGLNIKTVEQNEEKTVIKRQSKSKETISQQNSHKNIKMQNKRRTSKQFKIDKKVPLTQSKQKKGVKVAHQRSKSFILANNFRQSNHIRLKMFKMVSSNNMVLQSYGVYIQNYNSEARYKFYVGNGNNSNLIKSIIKQRWWWMETNDIQSANFVWTQLKNQPTIERQPKHIQNSQQNRQIKALKQKDEQDSQKYYSFFHQKLNKKLKGFTTDRERRILLKPFNIPDCVHNHFSHNYMFGNKNALFQNLTEYYQYKSQDVNSIIPLTFLIEDVNSQKFQDFLKISTQMKNTIWIVKPGQNSNRGKGIFVCKSGQQIRKKLSRRKNSHTYIIQKYVTNLILFNRRKFDIRTYLLMLSVGGVTKYFWYDEGYLRTSSQIFDLRNLNDFFIHLTNDAIQKKCDNYGKFQNGNKITYSEFQRYLQNNFPDREHSVRQLNEQMKKIAKIAVNATYNKIDPQPKSYCFELFGLDFIVDSNFKPWLIQINTNPCLELSSPTLERIIPRMIENLFRIALDPVFQATEDIPKSKSYYIYQNCLEKNKFQIIFDSLFDRDFQWQSISKPSVNKIYSQDKQLIDGDGVQVNAIY